MLGKARQDGGVQRQISPETNCGGRGERPISEEGLTLQTESTHIRITSKHRLTPVSSPATNTATCRRRGSLSLVHIIDVRLVEKIFFSIRFTHHTQTLKMANWISAASKMRKKCTKLAYQYSEVNGLDFETNYNNIFEIEMNEMDEIYKISLQMKRRYDKIVEEDNESAKAYFVTVRPDPAVPFETFKAKVEDFASRKVLEDYTLVFEQKGEDEATQGEGFHMHMLLEKTSLRSKADILRAAQSTFKHLAAPQCCRVDRCKTVKDVDRVKSYILEWASEDGHKDLTKQMDIAWRESRGLKPFYGVGGLSSTHGPIDSPGIPPPITQELPRNYPGITQE